MPESTQGAVGRSTLHFCDTQLSLCNSMTSRHSGFGSCSIIPLPCPDWTVRRAPFHLSSRGCEENCKSGRRGEVVSDHGARRSGRQSDTAEFVELLRARLFRTVAEYHFSTAQGSAIKFRPKNGQGILLFGTFVKCDKNRLVCLESRIENHIKQPAVAFLQNILRSPG